MNKTTSIFISLISGLLIGTGGLMAYQHLTSPPAVTAETTQKPAKPLYYRNPMNPEVTSPVPAKDHMGMDYIPVYEDEASAPEKAGTVKIDPVTEQNIGVRTATAKLSSLSHLIRTVGKVTYDEERISKLHPKTEGWVEKLFVDKTGTQVNKNTMLLSVYSPQLVTSSQEYLLAISSAKTLENSPFDDIRRSAEQMVVSARERLALLDVPEHQIRDMVKTGNIPKALHIHSPFTGTVINIGAREGQYVTPQTELYMLADLSKVWVIAQVYESDLPWVNENDTVDMQLTAIPGKTFKGTLSYIYPYAEAATRTIKVRMAFDNPDLLLKPDMFANVTIHTKNQPEAITVPTEAIIRSGDKEQVFIMRAAGQFEPRKVTTGLSADGRTQILNGVKVGDEVVTSSQFLIDSESKLNETTEKMRAIDAPASEEIQDHQQNMLGQDMLAPASSSSMTMPEMEHHHHD
ncbi:efflux RND transporter periplasmic adaptor subunit [Methylophaga thalassica]|uniref:efflux RND transporter periplasmic adaptor subunit n=1 Tax=Methylophaga thalassica TaxID=40223 RepID=UPI002E7AC726|nr:efflux RND transporter periplasmic adaptor subunit [Methylophaga thalassica]WVI86653.1 efflux RND transporter periplasmic adaptor subunit [Methylophaga thalassica]